MQCPGGVGITYPTMRIIAGEFRGRRLASPEGAPTRPMLDRAREALFSTLGERVVGARVLDLFAGSGSLGIEALSRGAEHVRFVERDRRARRVLSENVSTFALEARSECRAGDALDPESWGEEPWELVLLDPPYAMLRDPGTRSRVLEAAVRLARERVAAGGALVLHTHPRDLRAGDLSPLEAEERVYGHTALWYAWVGE